MKPGAPRTPAAPPLSVPRPGRRLFRAALALCVAVPALLYCRVLTAPFVFDDHSFIVDDREIQDWGVFFNRIVFPSIPPGGLSDNQIDPSRPLTFFTYAVNYWIGRMDTLGYHLFNLAVHIGVVLLVFFLTGRLLELLESPAASGPPAPRKDARPAPPPARFDWRGSRNAVLFALFAALLFAVHPMNTEVAAYISHRSDSLATFFFLASILFFLGACEVSAARAPALNFGGWRMGACVAGFALAFLSKQIAITLPAVLLALDFVFLSGFRPGRMKARTLLHGCLWLAFAFFVVYRVTNLGFLGDPSGETARNWTPLSYFLTQLRVVPRYFSMMIAPLGQCFDHAVLQSLDWRQWIPGLMIAAGLLAAGFWAVRRFIAPAWSGDPKAQPAPAAFKLVLFGTAWTLVTLAPTSSFLPINDPMAERRMYLPGVGFLLALAAVGWFLFGEGFAGPGAEAGRGRKAARLGLLLLMGGYFAWLCGLTVRRNELYRDPIAMWKSVIRLYPWNARAHYNLAKLYHESKDDKAAVLEYRKVIGLTPGDVRAYNNLGNLYKLHRWYPQAVAELQEAIRLDPMHLNAHYNLGQTYEMMGRKREAFDEYRMVLQYFPSPDIAKRMIALARELGIPLTPADFPASMREAAARHLAYPGSPPPGGQVREFHMNRTFTQGPEGTSPPGR